MGSAPEVDADSRPLGCLGQDFAEHPINQSLKFQQVSQLCYHSHVLLKRGKVERLVHCD